MIQIPNEIKQLLKQGSVLKNFRVHFPNGEHEDLTNADIVEESVTLTESICSASQLKIGMCETPSIEFETIGVGYIKGAEMECSLEVECVDTKSDTWVSRYYTNSDVQPVNLIYISVQDILGVEYVPAGIEVQFGSDETVESIEIECSEDGISWESNEIASDVDSFIYIATTEAHENYVKGFYVKLYELFSDEDGVMFGIKGYPLPGVVYKEDIDKYVYPIPYGTYIVDSCKKQANMSHRQIIGYNKIAYNNWQLNNLTKELFTKGFYWYTNNISVSIEGLIKLLSIDVGDHYELMTPRTTQWDRGAGTHFTEDGITKYYTCDVTFAYYTYNEKPSWGDVTTIRHPQSIHRFKVEYDPEFIAKINTIKQDLAEQIPSDKLNEMFNPRFAIDPRPLSSYDITFRKVNSQGRYDYLVTTKDAQFEQGKYQVAQLENPYSIQSGIVAFTAFDLSDDGTGDCWYTQGYYEVRVPISLKVYYSDSTGVDRRVLYDTGEYSVNLYKDTTAVDVNMFQSPSGLYFKLPSKKKSVTMRRNDTVSDVTKKLYKYDTSSLNSLNLKGLLQAYLEIQGKFGLITRDGNIKLVSVNEAFNSPDDTIPKSDYYTLWYDDFPSKPYGRITASYKDGNGDDMFAYYDLVENFSDAEYKTYDISNNYFIKNYNYTEQQIQTILQTMGQNMTNISYMPMNLSMKGRPDLEAGDVVIVNSTEQEITGFIMQRTITGIQGLVDDISSQDDTDQSLLASLGTVYDKETGTLSLYLSESRR